MVLCGKIFQILRVHFLYFKYFFMKIYIFHWKLFKFEPCIRWRSWLFGSPRVWEEREGSGTAVMCMR